MPRVASLPQGEQLLRFANVIDNGNLQIGNNLGDISFDAMNVGGILDIAQNYGNIYFSSVVDLGKFDISSYGLGVDRIDDPPIATSLRQDAGVGHLLEVK